MRRSLPHLLLLAALPLVGCGVVSGGGAGNDAATAVTVHSKATFVAGYFEGTARFDDFTVTGVGRDWFLGRLSGNDWIWAQSSGSMASDIPLGIDTDPGGDSVYVAGQQGTIAVIESYDLATGALQKADKVTECTEFSAVAAGEDAVFAACNNTNDRWTAIAVYEPNLVLQELFILEDGQGNRSDGRIEALRLTTRGLFVYGEFRDRIQVTRAVQFVGDDRLILVADGSQDVFLLRLDASELITTPTHPGVVRAKSGRSLAGRGDDEAADFALGDNDIFVAVRMGDDLETEGGRPIEAECPGLGAAYNFAILRLDSGIVPGVADPNAGDGINAPLAIDWWQTWGSCQDGVSIEALDHSGNDLLAAGTFNGDWRTDTTTLTSHGGADAFAMYVDEADGSETTAFSGGGEGDEQVFDDAQGGLAVSWVVGSYIGDQPTFPLVVFDEESLLRGTEEVLPGTSNDEVMVWRMPF